MKISLTPIPYCIMLLFSHFLHAGFEMTSFHSIPTDLHTQVRLLLCDVQEGRKEKADLNKRIILKCMYRPIPVIGLAQEVDEESLHLMRQMLEAGADPNVTTDQGETALRMALAYGSTQGVRLLLKYGADAKENSDVICKMAYTIGDVSRNSKIQEFRKREAEIVENIEALVQYGADVNWQPCGPTLGRGKTALHELIYNRPGGRERGYQLELVNEVFKNVCVLMKFFLRNGADPYRGMVPNRVRTLPEINVIDYARENKVPECARFIVQGRRVYWITRLLSHGTKADESLNHGPFPVELADLIAQHRFGFSWDQL